VFEKSLPQPRRVPRRLLIIGTAIAAVGILFYGYRKQEDSGNARIEELKTQAAAYRQHIMLLENQIYNLQRNLADLQYLVDPPGNRSKQIQILSRHIFSLHNLSVERLSNRSPQSARLLNRVLELRRQRVPYSVAGQSLNEGFDSPNFAAFVLRDQNLLGDQQNADLLANISKIWKQSPAVRQPFPGDLVFYPDGYVFFYFEDRFRGPFIIGMTSFGILALDFKFAKALGYRRISYAS
jgi:hypothetical protein